MTKTYVPDRGDIVWLDFEPTKGKEIGKYRPALVLTSKRYNKQTGLLICCPISSSSRGAMTEVPVGNIDNQSSVVAASLIQTLSWKMRQVKYIAKAESGIMQEVLYRLLPLICGDDFLQQMTLQ